MKNCFLLNEILTILDQENWLILMLFWKMLRPADSTPMSISTPFWSWASKQTNKNHKILANQAFKIYKLQNEFTFSVLSRAVVKRVIDQQWNICCQNYFYFLRSRIMFSVGIKSTLRKLNPFGLKKKLWLRENLTMYVRSKAKETKEKGACIHIGLRLRRRFNLCEFDLGRVNCINWSRNTAK